MEDTENQKTQESKSVKNNACEITKAIKAFKTKMSGAADSIYEASKIYAEAVSRYGDEACAAFSKAYPGVTSVTWDKMRLVAKDALIPEALFVSDRLATRLSYMPVSDQRKQLGGRKTVKVVTPSGNVVEKPLTHLSIKDEAVVFSSVSGKMRTVEEQRLWYAERMAAKRQTPAYEVRGNVLIVRRATKIGKAELIEIVGRMK